MRIRVDTIPAEGVALEFETPAGDFPVLAQMVRDGDCRFCSPVLTRLRIHPIVDMMAVAGGVEVCVAMECSRCLAEYEAVIAGRFDLTFTDHLPEIDAETGEDGREVTAEDMGVVLFEGPEIRFDETVQEQVVLALPFRPLCRSDCKGLCARCGKDLNAGPCGCGPAAAEGPFAVLGHVKAPER